MKARATALMLLLAVGCAGPRPPSPGAAAVVPPDAWRTGAPSGRIAADWWQGFGDPVMTRLVETALADNVDIALAATRVEEARAQFRLARGQELPTLVLAGGGGRQRDVSPFGQPREQWAGQAQASVAYDLDLFGRLSNATDAARANLLASDSARDAVRLAVAASVANGYLGLRAADARLAILRDTLAARADALHLARRRAEAGYAPRLDLAQAEAEYRATEQLIPAAELAIRRQEDGLSLLLGTSPRVIERGLAISAIGAPDVPAMLPSDLLRARPDIASAEQQLAAADHSLDAARAAFLPRIQLGASGGYVASTLLTDPIGIFSLGNSILAPLFDDRLQAQQGIAAARRNQAAFAYRKTALTAFQEVEDALAATLRTAEQERAIILQRDAAAEVLRLATNRYRAGQSPYLEQLDAQRALLGAELSLVQSRLDRLSARVTLYQALGGGWRSADR